MNAAFLQVLNMSWTASYVILFVLTARLFLKKAPKIFSYVLWGVVLFRLVCPFSLEGLFSLIMVNPEPIPDRIVYAWDQPINAGIEFMDHASPDPTLPAQIAIQDASVKSMQIWVPIGAWLWFAGIAILLIYSMISLLRLRTRLVGAVRWRDNIFFADHIASPFVMGLLRPRIYLPSMLPEWQQKYIIMHEQTHIRRLDHIVKIVAFLALTVHWFNPLVWISFFLCSRDMEMSCDESVMKQMNTHDTRREYSASLLSLATGGKIVSVTPLGFGEGDIKERITNVMNYKKPTFWIVAACVVICGILIVCLITNPRMAAPIEADFTTKALHYRKLPVLNESKVTQYTVTSESAGIKQGFYKAHRNIGTDVWDYFTYGSADAAEGNYSYIVIGGIKYDLGYVGYGDGGADNDYILKNHGCKMTHIEWDTPVYQLNRTFGLAAMTTSYLTIEGGIPYIILDTSGWGEQYDLDADGMLETTANAGTGTRPDYVIYEWEQSSKSVRCIQLAEALDYDVVTYLAEENLFYAADWNEDTATYESELAYAYRDGKLVPQR